MYLNIYNLDKDKSTIQTSLNGEIIMINILIMNTIIRLKKDFNT